MGTDIKTITTGVDKLVKLVMQHNRISLEDAAKALSMPKKLVEEWADFLEEKEVIGIEYKFAKPYLFYKDVTPEKAEERIKAFSDRKEGFMRKIDSALQYLEQESQGLPKLKEEFEKLTIDIDSKFKHAKKELALLARYDDMKKSVDTQIMEQEKKLQERRETIEGQIDTNRRATSRYLKLIDRNRQELNREEVVTNLFRKNEEELENKLHAIISETSVYEEKINAEHKLINETVLRIGKLKEISRKAKEKIEEQKKELTYLIEESKKHEKKIDELERGFLDKFSSIKAKKQDFSSKDLKKIRLQFHKIFSRKFAAEKFMNNLETDINDLKKELKELANEALLLKLGSKSSNIENYSREFEEKFEKLKKSKDVFRTQVNQLLNIIKKP